MTTDTVMGGLSTLSIFEEDVGVRFHGSLSLRNNGGFVSARMTEGIIACPKDAMGIRISWAGDERCYRLILHERGRRVREYFECPLSEQTETLLWGDFTHRYRTLSDTKRRLNPNKLISIGVLLSKTHSGTVDFYLQQMEWVLP